MTWSGGQVIKIGDIGFHDCLTKWIIFDVGEAKHMSKLMECNAVKVVKVSLKRPTIGIKLLRRIENNVGFCLREWVGVSRPPDRDGEGVITEIIAKDSVRIENGIEPS